MRSLSTREITLAVVALTTLSACSSMNRRTTTVESGGEVVTNTTGTPVNNRSLPAGATLVTTLDQTLGTKESKAGDAFTATVSTTLLAQDGSIVVPAGAKIEGRVTATDDSDNPAEPALIRLAFDRIRFNGQSYPLAATIVNSSPVQTADKPSGDRNRNIIIGGAVGAAIGAILGDKDLDKIVIGGAIGAAAGSIVSLGTEVNAKLPAGSQMTVRVMETTVLR
jgi:hypothetical protein